MSRIKKIHIESLMQILSNLYNRGADFVDIEGVSVEGQDIIRLYFQDAYIDPEYMNEFEEFMEEVGGEPVEKNREESPTIEMKKLTDKDLNELIG
jgi:hypothetical protein